MRSPRDKKNMLLPIFLLIFAGFLIGVQLLSSADSWVNGTNYLYPNSSWSNNVNVSGNFSVDGNIISNVNMTDHNITDIDTIFVHNITGRSSLNIIGNLSISDTGFVAGSKICTVGNGLCSSGGGNSSWNQSYANTLYASISVTGDNTSWNQSGANLLYYPLSGNPSGYLTTYAETDPLWTSSRPSYVNYTALNGAVGANLTLAQINANMGNWSADKASYLLSANALTLTQVAANVGNWTLDKTGYSTTVISDTRYIRNTTIPTCTGNDKLTSAGNGLMTCATDQTGAGGGGISNASDANLVNLNVTTLRVSGQSFERGLEVLNSQTYKCAFMVTQSTTMCYPDFLGTAITGTSTNGIGIPYHPGTVNILSTAAANTGYCYESTPSAFSLQGNETFKISINVTQDTNLNRSWIRWGFLDSVTASLPVDGVYGEIWQNATAIYFSAATANNSAYNYTANFSVTGISNTYVNCNLSISSNAGSASFSCFNDANTLLWNNTLTRTTLTGVPNVPGRETGDGICAVRTTAGTIRNIIVVDQIRGETGGITRLW